MKDDLNLRPIYHKCEQRIEAHIFVAFLAYCLHVTLGARLKPLAPTVTPRAVLDKLAAVQMLEVHFPTTDGLGHEPLHGIQCRPKIIGQTAQARSAATATPTHHSNSKNCSRPGLRPVVETYGMLPLN
jgi:hypothetical protein